MRDKSAPTPEEIARSQDQQAQEFLKHGARLIQDPGADKLRLELTTDATALKDKKGDREGGQLEDAQVVNEMISSNRERRADVTAQDFLDWTQAHPYQALSFIIEQYGSLAEFQRQASALKDNPAEYPKPQAA